MFFSPEDFSVTRNITVSVPRVSHLLEKGSGDINEDVVLLGPNTTFGVFDGATSIISDRFDNDLTGGRLAAQICSDTFADARGDLFHTARLANKRISKRAKSCGVHFNRKEELWSTSAAVIRLNDNSFDWCQIGDCQILIVYNDNSFKLLGENPGHDIKTLTAWQKRQGDRSYNASETVLETMASEILEVRRRMNIDYGVLNGEQEAMNFLNIGAESLNGIKDIVLFSDGLMLPQKNPAALPEFSRFVSLYTNRGLKGIKDYVRSKQLSDLSCSRYPRFKPHDDISAVALSFGR